jgi:hypothetical protein
MPRGGASNRGPRSATWDSTNSRAAARTRLEPGIGTARRVVSDRLAPDPEAETTPYADSRFSRHKYRIAATAYDLTLDTRLPAARSCRPSARWRVRAVRAASPGSVSLTFAQESPERRQGGSGPSRCSAGTSPAIRRRRSGSGRAMLAAKGDRSAVAPIYDLDFSADGGTSILGGQPEVSGPAGGCATLRRGEPDGRRAAGTAGAPAPRYREGFQV